MGQLPGGGLVVRRRRFDLPPPERLAALSNGAELVACQIEEHVMFSAAYGFRNGVQVWSVVHDPNKGLYSLVVEGAAQPELGAIRARLTAEQDGEGGEEADVDFLFDVAPELVAALSGYRHDEDDSIAFVQLKPVRRGLLQSLFGRR